MNAHDADGDRAGLRDPLAERDGRTLFTTLTQGVVFQAQTGEIVSANPAAERILGLSLAQMQGRTSRDPRWQAIHEDGSDFPGDTHPSMVALRTGQEVHNVIMGVFHPERNEHRWIRVNAVPQFRPDASEPFEVYTTFEDITETRQAERALQERIKELTCLYEVASLVEQEEMEIPEILQGIVDLLPPAWQYPDIASAQLEWDQRTWSAPATGWSDPEWQQSTGIVVNGCTEGVLKVGYCAPRPDAYEGPFIEEERRLLDAVAQHIGSLIARRRARVALQQSENRFRSITEHAADFIFIKDADRRYTFVNQAMQALLGMSEAEIVGKTPDDIFGEEQSDTIREVDNRTFAGETVSETRCLNIGNEERCFHTVQTPLTVVDGKVTSIMGVVRDVTLSHRAEEREKEFMEKLARAERMEALGVLAGGIAHDFNNLLSPNVALPAIILEDLADVTPEQCRYIDDVRQNIAAIEQSSLRAAETIKNISVLGKTQMPPSTPVDTNDVVTAFVQSHELKELQSSLPNVRFAVELTQDSPWILGIRSQIDRLLSNLVRNAALAIDGEGTVTITTSTQRPETPIAGYELVEPGEYVVLAVRDTGVGMEPEVLDRIFEPFFTTRKKANRPGSGLGLAVVHGIVQNHGGAINVTTAVGKGTTFEAYFPATAGVEAALEEERQPLPTGDERILAVDDEPTQLFAIKGALQRQGYTIAEAADGHEALRFFEEAHAEEEPSPFDLLILDMVMTPGFDGIATLKAIRKLYPDQKAMILSGHASEESAQDEASTLGAGWLSKPCRRDELARAVRRQLDA